jgi:hypothetical protein
MLDKDFYLLFMAFELWSTNAEANPGSRCLGCMVARRTRGLRIAAEYSGGMSGLRDSGGPLHAVEKISVATHNGTQTGPEPCNGLEKALLKCKNAFEECFMLSTLENNSY